MNVQFIIEYIYGVIHTQYVFRCLNITIKINGNIQVTKTKESFCDERRFAQKHTQYRLCRSTMTRRVINIRKMYNTINTL